MDYRDPVTGEDLFMSKNTDIVTRWWQELWNERRLEVADELLAPEYVLHALWSNPAITGPCDVPGIQPAKDVVRTWSQSFADFKVSINTMVDAGDHVACTHTFSATQTSEFMGRPATGRGGAISGITIMRLQDGQIVEAWTSWDMMGMVQQLGWAPKPGTSPLGMIRFVLGNIVQARRAKSASKPSVEAA